MATTLLQLIDALADNIDKLSDSDSAGRRRAEELQAENADLRLELSLRDAEIDRLRQEVTFLTLSHRLADGPEKLVDARRLIARLIRTIDVCIALLKE